MVTVMLKVLISGCLARSRPSYGALGVRLSDDTLLTSLYATVKMRIRVKGA